MAELEERWRELGEFIREQRRIGQLSLRKLSEMAGISNPYLSQIERGLRKPSAEILRQIALAMNISAETLYIRAGILDDRSDEADLVAEIRRDPFISEDQKKTLVHIYESFRTEHLTSLAVDLVGDLGLVAASEPPDVEPGPTSSPAAPSPPAQTPPVDPVDPVDPDGVPPLDTVGTLDTVDAPGADRTDGLDGRDGIDGDDDTPDADRGALAGA